MPSFLTNKKNLIAYLAVIFGVLLILFAYGATIWGEVSYFMMNFFHKKYEISTETSNVASSSFSVFGDILAKGNILKIEPVNKDFSIVIEKIGVNVPVVLGVPVTDQTAYNDALRRGVAHAISSDIPSKEPGNVYLFAHSSLNFFSLGRYATAFNLIRKLEKGDTINIFFKGTRFEYEVINTEIFPGWNTYPLNRRVIEPILTLQTCDPPGTTLNRLIVTSKLKKMYED